MSRQSELNSEIHTAIVKSVEEGLTYKQAALRAGIEVSSLSNWLRRGREGSEENYAQLRRDVKRARAEAVSRYVDCLHLAAASKAWHAAAWWLERVNPSDFALNRKEGQQTKSLLASLTKAIESGKLTWTAQAGSGVVPTTGGDARPDAV